MTGRVDDSPDWTVMLTHEGMLQASGGSAALIAVVGLVARTLEGVELADEDADLDELAAWFTSCCNGDWEHGNGMKIWMTDAGGWSLEADLNDTDDEDRTLDLAERRTAPDWVVANMTGGIFRAECGPRNLRELVRTFAAFVRQ
ncbi:MAG: hypothetical protein JWP97_3012 [Labilithrix sp.]|nr:hypothetical protein [Labilithrix sp.]